MKNRSNSLPAILAITFICFAMLLASSCEGPAGVPGADANESCIQCHNDDVVVLAATTQASNSGHQTGTSFERNGTSCAVCHTHQGFLEHLETGEMTTAENISNPLPQGCRTCHKIHENFDESDFELRSTEAVSLSINEVEVDLGASSNACVTCHQPRVPSPFPVAGGDDLTITSNRWGPHHGTQSTLLYGTGGYEISGSESYQTAGTHSHAGVGCVSCHMSEPFGAFAGGHSFSMSYEYHGSETAHLVSCVGCHNGIDDLESFDWNGGSSEVIDLLEQLEAILISQEILNENTGLWNASSGSPLVVSPDVAGAMHNFRLVEEDGSHGVHNTKYAKALLQNSIEVFN
jgi:hypothetical protein